MEAHEVPTTLPDSGHELEPIHPGSGRGEGPLKRIGAALAAIGLFIAKLGAQAKLLLLALPKLKLLTTSGSMLVSIVAYQLIFGWLFSIGFVLLLLLHELGHVFQLRREGVKASAPMFIPFLGAVISAKSMGDDAGAEARVGLAGPILGSIATLVIAMTFFFPSPIVLLILLLGGMETWRRWQARNTPEGRAYHQIPTRTRVLVAVTYLALIVALAVGVSATHLPRGLSDV
jgi:Zn-dependent protease